MHTQIHTQEEEPTTGHHAKTNNRMEGRVEWVEWEECGGGRSEGVGGVGGVGGVRRGVSRQDRRPGVIRLLSAHTYYSKSECTTPTKLSVAFSGPLSLLYLARRSWGRAEEGARPP